MCLNNQVCKDAKESREESSVREKSSAARAEEVKPEVPKANQSSNQVCKDEKESREESSAREKSSAAKAKEVTSELTTAKQSNYRRAQKTTPIVRRRVPRQFTPTETQSKQVNLGGKCHFSKCHR